MDTGIFSFQFGYFVGTLLIYLGIPAVAGLIPVLYHLIRGHGAARAWATFKEVFLIGAAVMLTLHAITTLLPEAKANSGLASEKSRSQLVGGFVKSCFPSQRAEPLNKFASDHQVRKYCTCAGSVLTEGLTNADIAAIKQAYDNKRYEAINPILLKGRTMQSIADRCASEAMR